MADTSKLGELRDTIDEIDNTIVELLAQRARAVGKIAILKSESDIQSYQPERFNTMKKRLHLLAVQSGLDPVLIDTIWEAIHESSIAQQRAYLSGPSFHE